MSKYPLYEFFVANLEEFDVLHEGDTFVEILLTPYLVLMVDSHDHIQIIRREDKYELLLSGEYISDDSQFMDDLYLLKHGWIADNPT